jgi:hypothetical protein
VVQHSIPTSSIDLLIMRERKVTSIPLFTSLPSRLTRFSSDGAEIGSLYASECIRSWLRSGFEPYTINSRSESPPDNQAALEVNALKLDRDAADRYGKPLAYLQDFFDVICNEVSGPVVITNADIFVDISKEDFDALSTLEPGRCIVSKRIDVEKLTDREGSEYPYGYDFFGVHTEDLARILCSDLAFGMPWWDHFLPLRLLLGGVEVSGLSTQSIFHLKHSERWMWSTWVELGDKLEQLLKESIGPAGSQTPLAADYFEKIAMSRESMQWVSIRRYKMALKGLLRKDSARYQSALRLDRLATLNVDHIDHWSVTLPVAERGFIVDKLV